MKLKVVSLVYVFVTAICTVTDVSAKPKSKKTIKVAKSKTSSTTVSMGTKTPSTCGPYTADQLKEKQVEAADLIDDCNHRGKNCAAAQSMISKINQTILNIDAMNFVYGYDRRTKEPIKDVIDYAINIIKSTSCFSKKTDSQHQLQFLKTASPTYVLSASIACQNNVSYFRTRDAAYSSSAPLSNVDYSMMPEYSYYINDQNKNEHGDPWTIVNIPYKVVDKERSKASPISITDTARFGYLKTSGKIVPINFEGFDNLIVSASACVYAMNNDNDRSNDDYIPPVVTDFSYAFAKR